MSDPNYKSHIPNAPSRNHSVNYNYVWDNTHEYWTPLGINKSDSILSRAKSSIHKFGSNGDVPNQISIESPVTIWDFQTNYSFPLDSGQELFIESASTLDVGQEISVFGLDENFNSKEISVELNGSNRISLGGLWTRVFRMYNSGSTELNGDISVIDSSDDVFAYLLPENNQTLMALYTIPAEYTGYLMKFHCSAQNTSSSLINYTIHLKIREFGKVFRTRKIISCSTQQSDENELLFPLELPPKTDVVFQIVGADGNGGSVNADFDIALL
jgi:hypothetical protein